MRAMYVTLLFTIIFMGQVTAQAWRLTDYYREGYGISTTFYDSTHITYHASGHVEDSIIYDVDNITGLWKEYRKHHYTFNGNNKPQELLLTDVSTSTPLNIARALYTYNSANRLQTETYQNWIAASSTWQDDERTIHNYSLDGLTDTAIYQSYLSGVWATNQRVIETRNAQGKTTRFTLQYWDGADWTNYYRSTTDYNAQGLIAQYVTENGPSGPWDSTSRYVYTYNSANKVILEERYDLTVQPVVVESRTGFDYDPITGLLSIETYQSFNGTTFDPVQRHVYAYDANGFLTMDKDQRIVGCCWENYDSLAYVNDVHGNRTVESFFEWDDNLNVYDHEYVEKYYYEEYTPSGILAVARLGNVKVYPNPVQDVISISFAQPLEEQATITLFTLDGKNVLRLPIPAGLSTFHMDVPMLQQGVYLYHIDVNGKVATGQFVK